MHAKGWHGGIRCLLKKGGGDLRDINLSVLSDWTNLDGFLPIFQNHQLIFLLSMATCIRTFTCALGLNRIIFI